MSKAASSSSTCLHTRQFIVGQMSSKRIRYCGLIEDCPRQTRALHLYKGHYVLSRRLIVDFHESDWILLKQLRDTSVRRKRMPDFQPQKLVGPGLNLANKRLRTNRYIAFDIPDTTQLQKPVQKPGKAAVPASVVPAYAAKNEV